MQCIPTLHVSCKLCVACVIANFVLHVSVQTFTIFEKTFTIFEKTFQFLKKLSQFLKKLSQFLKKNFPIFEKNFPIFSVHLKVPFSGKTFRGRPSTRGTWWRSLRWSPAPGYWRSCKAGCGPCTGPRPTKCQSYCKKNFLLALLANISFFISFIIFY